MIMKSTLLAIIVGLSVASMGTIYASDLATTSLAVASPSGDTVGLLGHIEFEVRDSSDNIKGYYQTDNFITDVGAACAAQQLFVGGASGNGCTNTPGDFLFIALGDSQPGTDVKSDTTLDNEITTVRRADSAAAVVSNANAGTATVTVATNDPFTFTTGGSNVTNNVFQAGLFDAASTGNAFAIQNTTSGANPGIDVNDGDSLSVTWTITVG